MELRERHAFTALLVICNLSAQARADNASQAPGAEASLPAVEVAGSRGGGAYYAAEATDAKSDLRLRELPRSVGVVSQQILGGRIRRRSPGASTGSGTTRCQGRQ